MDMTRYRLLGSLLAAIWLGGASGCRKPSAPAPSLSEPGGLAAAPPNATGAIAAGRTPLPESSVPAEERPESAGDPESESDPEPMNARPEPQGVPL
jgi:hypothetical protein